MVAIARRLLVACIALTGVVMTGCGPTTSTTPPGDESTAPAATASRAATASPAATTSPATSAEAPADAGVVELPGDDPFTWRMAVASDGETALVGRSSGFFPTSRQSRIDLIRLQPNGTWGENERASFSTESSADLDPFFTADGSRVWFSSIRPVDGQERTDTDIWYVDRAPDGSFGEPVNPGPAVNSPAEDLYPTVGPDGTLYFGSDRGGNGFDIWRVASLPDGGWGSPEPLPAPVTTDAWEFNPAIAPDGRTLVFTALNRAGGEGLGDLWFTTPAGEGWTDPKLLTAVNSARDEYHASFSPDGTTMFFVRDGTLHEVATDGLGLPPAP